MINLILVILVIHYLGVLIIGNKTNVLSCGIFGWAGKSPKQFNKGKLDILGIFNEARGVHSCGIAKDGEIFTGLDKNKLYKSFLANVNYTSPKKIPSVIGHTRQSTVGTHNIFNAHPFGFGTLNEQYEFIGVHNGTLINYKQLAKDYGVDTTSTYVDDAGKTINRTKIDSEILLEILYKTKNFTVLSKYIGAAALVWTDLNNPNVVYYYHGKSRKSDIDIEAVEERPLYYYKNGPNNLYVSSMLSSLTAIGAGVKKDDWGEFETNTVYKVTDGDITNAIKTIVDRNKMFQTGFARYGVSTGCSQKLIKSNFQEGQQCKIGYKVDRDQKSAEIDRTHKAVYYDKKFELINNNLYFESPAQNINHYRSRIYFNKLRYWRNGHRINGCYTWIPGHGFYFLAESDGQAVESFYALCNKTFLHGEFTDENKIPAKYLDDSFIPFVHGCDGEEYSNPLIFYFYDGIRVKSLGDYVACMDMDNKYSKPFGFIQLSHCAAHPVLDILKASKPYSNQEIYFEGMPVTDIICPLGSEKLYDIKAGNCGGIITLDDKGVMQGIDDRVENISTKKISEELTKDDSLETVIYDLQEMEDTIYNAEVNIEDDLLEDDINDFFKEPLRKFPMYIRRLKSFKESGRASEATEILDNFVKTATKLISIEIKE